MTATIEGRTYEIPDMWMAGATRFGRSYQEAVLLWHEQHQLEAAAEMGATAATHIDVILRTKLSTIEKRGRLYGSDLSKAIRDLFRSLGWGKFFRVTKGCWSLGPSIEWANGFQPVWVCDRTAAQYAAARVSNTWMNVPHCFCPTCKHREAQKFAIARRVSYVLNLAFADGRPFGDRSDSQSDYFDADYTFHP
jgi:hypothetical protein